MKQLSPAMFDSLSEAHGTEPIIVVGINWGAATSWYSTKTVEDAGIVCKAVIKSVGEILVSKRSDNEGSTGSVELSFYDTDGEFKLVTDLTRMEGTRATVFQHFNGLKSNDWFPLLSGRVANPRWTEGNRVFTCTIEAKSVSDEVGFAPVPDDFNDLAPEAYGVPWPLLFGKVAMSPCVHVRKHTEGLLKTNIQLDSEVYHLSADKRKISWVQPNEVDVLSYFEGTTTSTNKIYVRDGSKFPQAQVVKIEIDKVIFEGTFDGDEFTCTSANLPRFENVKFAARVTADPDEAKFFVAWLREEDGLVPNLVGHHVFFTSSQDWYNFVVKQDNDKIWFKYPTFNPNTHQNVKIGPTHTIKSAFAIEPSGVVYEISEKIFRFRQIQDVRAQILSVIPSIPVFGLLVNYLDGLPRRAHAFWGAEAGTKVKLFKVEDPDIYLISLNTVAEIYAVYGKKRTKLGTHEQTSFAPIPDSYYEEQLESNYAVDGLKASALLFRRPLSDYDTDTEKWEDAVYVSCRSSVGPNTADIIYFLLYNFTDYEIDSRSFNEVKDQLVYDSNFGLYDRKDALDVCRDIAWQARCALLVDSDKIELKYLALQPTSIIVWTAGDIQYKSMEFLKTNSTKVITRLIGTWRESNEFNDPPQRLVNQNRAAEIRDIVRAINEAQRRELPSTNIALWEENQDRYGVNVETHDVFIYNEEEPVQKCIDFWGHIGANIWKKLQFKTAILGINYQPWDAVTVSTAITGAVPGLVEEIRYDTNEKDVGVMFWLPIQEGHSVVDTSVWNG